MNNPASDARLNTTEVLHVEFPGHFFSCLSPPKIEMERIADKILPTPTLNKSKVPNNRDCTALAKECLDLDYSLSFLFTVGFGTYEVVVVVVVSFDVVGVSDVKDVEVVVVTDLDHFHQGPALFDTAVSFEVVLLLEVVLLDAVLLDVVLLDVVAFEVVLFDVVFFDVVLFDVEPFEV